MMKPAFLFLGHPFTTLARLVKTVCSGSTRYCHAVAQEGIRAALEMEESIAPPEPGPIATEPMDGGLHHRYLAVSPQQYDTFYRHLPGDADPREVYTACHGFTVIVQPVPRQLLRTARHHPGI
jgi:hypothetical protein